MFPSKRRGLVRTCVFASSITIIVSTLVIPVAAQRKRGPTVSITAPVAGATVSGTAVTVSASASSSLGIAGVQFQLDGTNLGAELTSAPYTGSWNSPTANDGSHTLTAVARDQAGNRRTSAGVTVTVKNLAPPPPPGGIAAQYPGDVGIQNHQDVVFVERFDEATLADLFKRWTDILNGSAMTFSTDVPPGSPGQRSLNIPWVGGGVNNGGHLYKLLSPGVDDKLYVRYYIKYPTTGKYSHTGVWMGGYNPPLSLPNPHSGTKPAGNDRFIAAAEHNTQTSRFDHYDYWMDMHQSADGNHWGNLLLNNPNVQAKLGQWMCVEHMVKLNNPTTSFNGEHAIWLDGTKISHLGQGFPDGSWTGGIFTQNSSGSPFEGFRWRSDPNLNLNWIWLQNYANSDPAGFTGNMKFAHAVVATSYIGCLASGASDVAAPTVGVSSPLSGATVSGSTTVSASASDNVGVMGVQFKLDGTNLGPEDTSAPYSGAWTTTSTANGSHTLTAVARDAAGNAATSMAVTVIVANAPTITSLTPTNGTEGTSVTISGTNFTGATTVRFNGTSASFTVSSATAIQATVPTGATTGTVSATTAGGTATSSGSFTVMALPTITSFTPSSGAVGTSVTISGTNFTGATTVRFNGTTASFTVSSATAIQATVPTGATTGTVSVTKGAGTATSSGTFTVSAPPPPPTILWSADHEEGNMSDWYTPSGGGEFNSGGGVSAASTDVAHSGKYSAKATIATPPSPSAVRLFRWAESRANPEAYYSAWFYFPRTYTPTWWNIDQFKSRSCSTCDPDPFWFVQVGNRPNGTMFLYLTWWYGPWPNGTVEGPHQGEFGGRDFYQSIKDLPTNQWVHVEIFLRQSASFTGEIVVWQDGVEILRQSNVKTRYPFMGDEWALSSYSGSISPSPATIYIDDAAISTARLGPGSSDTTPPAVSLSAPAPGATVSGTVPVSASASDNVGVAGVQFKSDGVNIGTEDTTSPYSVSWNTTTAINGSHTLSAVVRDAGGNTATSVPVSVTVSNTGTACQTSGASWQNQTFVPRTGIFTARYDVTPSTINVDGVTGLAAGAGTTYTDLAAIVRFNNSGTIDARNGGAYSALVSIPYAGGTTYQVRMVVNVPSHTYSAYVTPSSGTEQALALNYAFRSEQAAASTLSTLASFTSAGTLQICNLTITP